MLQKFGMSEAKPIPIPLDQQHKLDKTMSPTTEDINKMKKYSLSERYRNVNVLSNRDKTGHSTCSQLFKSVQQQSWTASLERFH